LLELTFSLPLRPKPSPRSGGRFKRRFMPKDYMAWKKQFGMLVPWQAKKSFNGALGLWVVFIYARPKSHKPGSDMVPVGDVDNLSKGVMDALQDCGVIENDRQVTYLTAVKRYGAADMIKVCLGPPPGWAFD
jgi:Holliday junction resolvase RusA-like endonuclease